MPNPESWLKSVSFISGGGGGGSSWYRPTYWYLFGGFADVSKKQRQGFQVDEKQINLYKHGAFAILRYRRDQTPIKK